MPSTARSKAAGKISLQDAIALHQAGKLQEAETVYTNILAGDPDNASVLQLLGLIFAARNEIKPAEHHMQKSLSINPKQAVVHYNLGMLYAKAGRKQEALASFDSAVRLKPDYSDASLALIKELLDSDQIEEAKKRAGSLIARFPNNSQAHHYLGLARFKLQQYELSAQSLRETLKLTPNHADTWYHLGLSLQASDQHAAALDAYERALIINPSLVDATLQKAVLLQGMGDIEAAKKYYLRTIDLESETPAAYHKLGTLLNQEGNYIDAEKLMRRALLYAAGTAEIFQILGYAIRQQNRMEEAKLYFQKALQLKPDYAGALINLGNLYRDMGELKEAKDTFTKAIEVSDTAEQGYNNLGNVHLMLGETEEARLAFEKAISLKPDFGHAHRHLSQLRKYKAGDAHIAQMESLYAHADLSDEDRMALGFGLAKAYEDCKAYEKVFPFLDSANRARRSAYPDYSSEMAQAAHEAIKAAFSETFVDSMPQSNIEDMTPIFIVGMPRSGTTLTEQILSSHPLVRGGDELDFMHTISRTESERLTGKPYPASVALFNSDQLATIGNLYLNKLRRLAPRPFRITDKMPSNYQLVGLIRMALPRAKVIHCLRDPMDTCFSIYKHYFSGPQPFAYDQTELGKHYLCYADLMKHWHKVLPGFVFDMSYETVVKDVEAQARKLLEFCELSWNDGCLEFYKSERVVKTASVMQVRNPIYTSSVKSWEPYREHLKPLAQALNYPL